MSRVRAAAECQEAHAIHGVLYACTRRRGHPGRHASPRGVTWPQRIPENGRVAENRRKSMPRPTSASRCSKPILVVVKPEPITCNKAEGHGGPCQGTVKGPPPR